MAVVFGGQAQGTWNHGPIGEWDCPNCNRRTIWYLLESGSQGSIYGINVGKPGVGFQVICGTCRQARFIDHETAADLIHHPQVPYEEVQRFREFVDAGTSCSICAGRPATSHRVVRLTGVVMMVLTQNAAGPFCKRCGLATFRKYTNHSMLFGWLGIVPLAATLPMVLLINLPAGRRFARLREPEIDERAPLPTPPLDPGKPLWARPGLWVGVAAYVGIVWLVVAAFLSL